MHRDQVSPVLWVGSVLMSTFLPIIIFPRKALFGVKAPQKRTTPHLHTGQLGPLTSHYQGQEEWKQRESVVSPHWVQNIRERARYCVTRSGGGLWKLLLPAAPVSGKRWSRTLAWHPPDNCPNPLRVWAHTRTHTHGAPPVHGAEQPTKSSYVARRHMAFPVSVCSSTPSQPSEISPQGTWTRWEQWVTNRRKRQRASGTVAQQLRRLGLTSAALCLASSQQCALLRASQRKKGLFLTACAPHLRAKPGSGSSAKSHSSADREQFRSVSGTLELRWSRKTSAFLLAAVWATASPALSLLEPKPEAESCSEWNGID